jgi:mono/diheme cytochrome c family protein
VASDVSAHWKRPLLLLALVIGTATNAAAAPDAATLYAQRCAGCHGKTGNGDGPSAAFLTPRPLPFSTALKGKSDTWLATVITKGGAAAGLSPAMPAQPTLDETQVKDLIEYIKGLSSPYRGHSSSNLQVKPPGLFQISKF